MIAGIAVGFLGSALVTVIMLWRAEHKAPIYHDQSQVPDVFPAEWLQL